jgi:hypothetical protein
MMQPVRAKNPRAKSAKDEEMEKSADESKKSEEMEKSRRKQKTRFTDSTPNASSVKVSMVNAYLKRTHTWRC